MTHLGPPRGSLLPAASPTIASISSRKPPAAPARPHSSAKSDIMMINYDVSPDGQRFLLNAAADENTRPLTLVVNWTVELKKK